MPRHATFDLRRAALLILLAALLAAACPVSAGPAKPPPPSNDDFDNAVVITAIPFKDTREVLGATTAADDPFVSGSDRGENSTWYRYTPAANQTLAFINAETCVGIAIWTGARGSLSQRQASRDSEWKFAFVAGTTYHIELVRYNCFLSAYETSLMASFSITPEGTLPSALGKASPAGGATYQSTRPVLRWSATDYAANYAYCYDTVENGTCDGTWSKTTNTSVELTGLTQGTRYYWQVRAENLAGKVEADAGQWWSFATAAAADLNRWTGKTGADKAAGFDVVKDGSTWLNFSVTLSYRSCSGTTKVATITTGGPGPISGASFGQSGAFALGGTFASNTTATGWYRLTDYPICDWQTSYGYCCWAITNASGTWSASGPPRLPVRNVYLPALSK